MRCSSKVDVWSYEVCIWITPAQAYNTVWVATPTPTYRYIRVKAPHLEQYDLLIMLSVGSGTCLHGYSTYGKVTNEKSKGRVVTPSPFNYPRGLRTEYPRRLRMW